MRRIFVEDKNVGWFFLQTVERVCKTISRNHIQFFLFDLYFVAKYVGEYDKDF